MNSLIIYIAPIASSLALAMSPAVGQTIPSNSTNPASVQLATAGPDGFIVVKGVIYEVRQGRATVLPDSLRWTGTTQGVKGFPRAIQMLQTGFMLTTAGNIVPAPQNVVFSSNAVGTIAPVSDTNNATDNSITWSTDNSTDNTTTRSTDNSVDNRTTRATSNAIDNRTTRSTNNATDNSITNRSPR